MSFKTIKGGGRKHPCLCPIVVTHYSSRLRGIHRAHRCHNRLNARRPLWPLLLIGIGAGLLIGVLDG